MARKLIRQWRVSKAEPSGLMIWFDPSRELVRLYELDPREDPGVHEVLEGDDRTDSPEDERKINELNELSF